MGHYVKGLAKPAVERTMAEAKSVDAFPSLGRRLLPNDRGGFYTLTQLSAAPWFVAKSVSINAIYWRNSLNGVKLKRKSDVHRRLIWLSNL
jgi:hypothetical protein